MNSRITKLTSEDKEKLLSKTFYSMPDNPSNKNFSPSQIKRKGYEGFLFYFDVVNALIDSINSNVDDTNSVFSTINSALELKADKVGELPSYSVNTTSNVNAFLTNNNLDGKPFVVKIWGTSFIAIFNRTGTTSYGFEIEVIGGATRYFGTNVDLNGLTFSDILSSTYQHDYEDIKNKVSSFSGTPSDTNYPTEKLVKDNFDTTNAEIAKIKNGTTVVKKAECDESGDNIKSTYANRIEFSQLINSNYIGIIGRLKNKLGNQISSCTTNIQTATTNNPGFMSASDKVKVDNIATDIATALATAKSYADDKVARSNLVSVLGEASQSLNGLMSATDKTRLDTLFALLGDSADGDTVVNTINEVLAIFNQYPEGADLVSALARKVSFDDIIDNLTSENANKALSANQGKILKGLIDVLSNSKANASDVYNKTETYSQTQADDKFRTQTQVDDQIDVKLANVSALNVIVDEDNNKNYTYQIKIQNGKAHLIATEVE